VSAVLFAAAALLSLLIFSTEPEAQFEAATKRTPMLVEVVEAERGRFRPTLQTVGVVMPSEEVLLRPQVGGAVLELAEGFRPGAIVAADGPLLRIDPSDYRIALAQRRSELEQAESALAVERGEQAAARIEYEQLGRTLPPMQEALVLREPQARSAEARVAAARSAVERATLDLERTELRAPFAAQVLSREVNRGSLVAPGDVVARLVAMDSYWVEASVPLAALPQLRGDAPLRVRLRDRSAWAEGQWREGRVLEVIGELEGESRMLRVLIEVADPLALGEAHRGQAPLVLGSFVECHVEAAPIEDVVRLERRYLRQNDTAWVYQDGQLDIRSLDIAFRDADYVYVRSGLRAGDRVVTTGLSRVRNGAELRLVAGADAP
jgi:RND family efflux transporter MFP subunit